MSERRRLAGGRLVDSVTTAAAPALAATASHADGDGFDSVQDAIHSAAHSADEARRVSASGSRRRHAGPAPPPTGPASNGGAAVSAPPPPGLWSPERAKGQHDIPTHASPPSGATLRALSASAGPGSGRRSGGRRAGDTSALLSRARDLGAESAIRAVLAQSRNGVLSPADALRRGARALKNDSLGLSLLQEVLH